MNNFLTKFVVGAFALAFSVPNATAQTQLFTNTTNSSPEVYWRIPSIVRLTDGGLWAFTDKRYYAATDLGNGSDKPHQIEIYGIKSSDNGANWGSSAVVLKSNLTVSDDKEYLYAFGDAGTVVDRESGHVLMMTASGKRGVGSSIAGRPYVTRSVFDNNTWTTTNVSDQFYGTNNAYGTHLFVTSGRIIQSTIYKKDKYYRLYAGVCLFSKNASYVAYSDDFGQTWKYLGGDVTVPVQDGDECKVEELPNGDILLVTRKRSGATGRYVNVFKFSDIANGVGSWQTSVSTGASQTSGEAYASANNGEILLVPAKSEAGKQTYVLLLSVPASSDRSNVCIYWKELPTDYSVPSSYVSGWKKYQVNNGGYFGYTTMVLDQNGNIAFMSEMSQWVGPLSFISLPLNTITGGAYTYSTSTSGTYHTTSEPNFEHGVGGLVKPTLSVQGGTYTNNQTVTLNAAKGAQIYYTLDGSEPQVTTTTGSGVAPLRAGTTTTGTQLYTAPITLSEGTTTLKALAVDNNGNKSQTVTSTYTIISGKSKTGTTITLDHGSSQALYTTNGKNYSWFAFLRHRATHIQLISSSDANLKSGDVMFADAQNNMQWIGNDNSGWKLKLANGQISYDGGKNYHRYQYSHYAILAPKGYRFLRYEIVMTSGSANGVKLEEYTYKPGSSSEIQLVGSQASAAASSTGDVTLSRTLDKATNVLYFRQDALDSADIHPINIKSIKLVYAVDMPFEETMPNQNGTAFHSGFVNFGQTQSKSGYNYGFTAENTSDLANMNVKNNNDQTTPGTVTVDGANYFMATSNGNYYVEPPTKFRIVGATFNMKMAEPVSFASYIPIPSEATHGVQIVLGASTIGGNSTNTESTGNYLKIDDSGNFTNVKSLDQATVFTVDYHTDANGGNGENRYSLRLPNGKYLAMNSTPALITTDNGNQALWSYNSGWKFPYTSDKYNFIGAWGDPYTWRTIVMPQRSAIAYTKPIAASGFTATVYGPDGKTDVGGTKKLDATNPSASVTVDNLNNDAVRINLAEIQSGGAALFNVQLKMIALNPEVETVQAAALANGTGDAMGNSPVTSENYIFNHGNVINVPVTAGSKTATMVFRNAHNEELTNWYTNGGTNTNGASETGSYSNLYLIGSTADTNNSGLSSTPSPTARTSVDQIGTIQIPANNIDILAAEKDKAGTQRTLTLQDNTVNASSAHYQTVTMNVGSTTEPATYYLYSADKPTNEIMPPGIRLGQHIDFRFYSIKVNPVEAEVPDITIVPLYTSTLKGPQTNKEIAADVSTKEKPCDTEHTYLGIKVNSKLNSSASSSTTLNKALTAEAIYSAMKEAVYSKYSGKLYTDGDKIDTLRTVLYVDMSGLNTVTTANLPTMRYFATATADNCLLFMPKGFSLTNMANTVALQQDGTSYQAIGDVTLKDQQPFFTPHSFTTGQFKAVYVREGTSNGTTAKAKVKNMTSVLPFDLTLDKSGHPFNNGDPSATSYMTFFNITAFGKTVTGVRKDETDHELTYSFSADTVRTLKAEANKPYYVNIDKTGPAGFEFRIPGASFVQTPDIASDKTADPDNLTKTNDKRDWTAHGTYNGVAPVKNDTLWYFAQNLFWKSGQLKSDYPNFYIRPFRAYFSTSQPTPSDAAKAGVVYDPSEITPTGISDIQAAPAHNGRVYTIDGRYVGMSLDNLAPGLYIQNGRKVVKQ